MGTDLTNLGLREAAALIGKRRLSPGELLEAILARIDQHQQLGAFISVFADSARLQATEAATRLEGRRPARLLEGIPVSVKDLILAKEGPTTMGSRMLGDGMPAGQDAAVVAKLRRSGAVLLGKCNLHEVALGVTTVNEHFGPARNPWDLTRVAGGSSGGSAAAVAARLGPGSIGTDTRGSIRIPAACCGITGFKPSYGLIDTEGVLPLAATLDHVGPMARSVEDAALLLGAMTGRPAFAARARRAVDRKPRRLTIAVADYFFVDADPEVAALVEKAINQLQRQGHRLVATDIAELEPAMEASRIIVLAEAIAFHDEHLRRNPEGYGPNLRSRLEGGYQLSALQYVHAEEKRVLLIAAFSELFRQVDCLLTPTLPIPAVPIGTQSVTLAGREVSLSEVYCRYTAPENMTGVPALSVPCGFTKGGLPVGLQMVGGMGRDLEVLALGAEYQRISDWHRRSPGTLEKCR
ncbi:MAG: amidase [Gemmatimonadales bacterium]